MTTEIGKLNTVIIKPTERPETEIQVSTVDASDFLSLTNRFGIGNGLSKVEKKDVISGAVADEINKIQTEQDQITSIVNANSKKTFSTLSDVKLAETVQSNAKTIGFVKYSGSRNINAKTDTTAIKNCIVANNSSEKQLISDSIDLLCDWLDNYITNYDSKITEGLNRGDSELKQSFLLQVRNAIENIDFPIGFGDVGDTIINYNSDGSPIYKEKFRTNSNVLGCYTFAAGYYTDAARTQWNNLGYDALHLNVNRNILLNPTYFMPERPYKTVDEFNAALEDGSINAVFKEKRGLTFCIDEEAYNSYCKNYLASVFFHEIIHSTHIYNEAVTYFSNDTFDDDFFRSNVEGFSQETLDALKRIDSFDWGYEKNGGSVTVDFSDGVQYSDLLISNILDGVEGGVARGWDAIKRNNAFEHLLPDFKSEEDCRKELLNFAVTA